MFRYLFLAVSAIFLLISFTHPRGEHPSNIVYEWLFLFCMISFIPMMVVALYYFLKSIGLLLTQKKLRAGFFDFLVFAAVSTALYSFNKWVFHELF